MLKMKYIGDEAEYNVEFDLIAPNIAKLQGSFPVRDTGFTLSREGMADGWDYSNFTTVYKNINGGVMFSNDGSVYIEPEKPDPVPEEPYVPTLEEVKALKKQEIYTTYNADVAAGVDVELSIGTQHFPLQGEDREFLMGKQLELAGSTAEQVSYQDSDNHCMLLSREDMQKIITEALAFVNYKTTYRNNLCEWVDQCSTKEAVGQIFYGTNIPEEYQNEVYKMYLAKQGE